MAKKIEAWIQKEISSPQFHGCTVAFKENSHPRHLVTLGLKLRGDAQTAVPHTGLLPRRGKRCPELRHWREPTTPNSINTDCGNWGEEAQGTTKEGGPGKTNLWVGYNSAGTLPDTLRPRRPSEESKGASEADVCKPRRSRRSTR